MRSINKIIIHCSDTPPSMTEVDVAMIDEWHKAKGWDEIGYHYVIRRTGLVEEGRDLEIIGAHCKGHNTGSIGICLVGGRHGLFDFNNRQMHALERLVRDLKDSIEGGVSVHGHNTFSTKECPCFDVEEYFKK